MINQCCIDDDDDGGGGGVDFDDDWEIDENDHTLKQRRSHTVLRYKTLIEVNGQP